MLTETLIFEPVVISIPIHYPEPRPGAIPDPPRGRG